MFYLYHINIFSIVLFNILLKIQLSKLKYLDRYIGMINKFLYAAYYCVYFDYYRETEEDGFSKTFETLIMR